MSVSALFHQYKTDYKTFYQTAKHWAKVHAGAKVDELSDLDDKIKQLTEMGFKEVSDMASFFVSFKPIGQCEVVLCLWR